MLQPPPTHTHFTHPSVSCKQTPLVVSLHPSLLSISPSFHGPPLAVSSHACLSLPCTHCASSPPHTHTLSLSPHVCPFLSSLPSLFRGLFISLERWMRGWGHLQELIKPPSHTHTPSQILTHIQEQGDKRIQRCRCITKPIKAHAVHEYTALKTHSSEKTVGGGLGGV